MESRSGLVDVTGKLFPPLEPGQQLGATGRFPQGKAMPGDEGELALRVGSAVGKVFIDFGKPVAWVGMTAEEARSFANLILKKAAEAANPAEGEGR